MYATCSIVVVARTAAAASVAALGRASYLPRLQHVAVAVASGCCTFIERLLAVRARCNPNEVSNDNACHPPPSPCCMLHVAAPAGDDVDAAGAY